MSSDGIRAISVMLGGRDGDDGMHQAYLEILEDDGTLRSSIVLTVRQPGDADDAYVQEVSWLLTNAGQLLAQALTGSNLDGAPLSAGAAPDVIGGLGIVMHSSLESPQP